ncbi:MAG: hypothetical protein WCD37_11360 [Chloroflexia bacterium]
MNDLAKSLLLLVLGIYVLTMSGHTYSPDEETMLEASRSLVEQGSWAMPASGSLVQVEGVDGRTYSQYGPGQSFAAAPWVAAGRLIGTIFPKDQAGFPLRLLLGTYNALITAGIVALFAALGLALGYSRRACLIGALALGFCTYLWPHGRTFFSEPLTALALFASFYLLAKDRTRTTETGHPTLPLHTLASGALFALAIATKVQYVVTLPAFLIYLTWRGWDTPKNQDNTQSKIQNPKSKIQNLAFWLFGLALGLLPLMLYNWLVFGSPLSTGYGLDAANTLTNPFFEGVLGLLLSPGKGLLWFALPLLLALWGWPRFAGTHRPEAAFIVVLALPVIGLFSLYSFWHGDGSWGPRYLIPVLPFLLLPMLEISDEGRKTNDEGVNESSAPNVLRLSSFVFRRLSRLLLSTVLALGFLVNMLGALVNFDTYINVVDDLNTRHWAAHASPIFGHLNLLAQRTEEWSLRLMPGAGTTLFTGGFSYSEGDKSRGDVLPRWTTGAGIMQIRPEIGIGPALNVTLRLSDHRPPELPRAAVTILVDGAPTAASTAPVPGQPVATDYTFTIPNRPTTLTIQSDTWNPSTVQEGARDEDIGMKLESISIIQERRPFLNDLVEAMPAPPYYPQPRWYYDPGTHHFADIWPIYMAETGMGRKTMLALGLPFVALGALLVFFGGRGLKAAD